MANFEDFLSNNYPASYLASAHKDSSEGALANKKKLSPMGVNEPLAWLWYGLTEIEFKTHTFVTRPWSNAVWHR